MPPRFGKLDTNAWAKFASTINGFKTEEWKLKNAGILELHQEIDDDPADALIPRAMHPAIPAYTIINVMHVEESPVGEFSIAEVRVAGRTGVRPRGFVLRSYCNSEAARKELGARWGYPVTPGDVSLTLRHDRVVGRVKVDGRTILHVEQLDRDVISGNDIQYIASMHLAHSREDQKLVLIQVDPEYAFSRAERGRPSVVALDSEAFGAGGNLRLMNPIMASYTMAEVTLPKIRYVCNPELPALQGTTKVAA